MKNIFILIFRKHFKHCEDFLKIYSEYIEFSRMNQVMGVGNLSMTSFVPEFEFQICYWSE